MYVKRLLLFALCSFVWVSVLQAAPVRDEGRRLEDERKAEQRREHIKKLKPGTKIETGKTKKEGKEDVCFKIKRIAVNGVKTLKQKDVRKITRPYLGKCLGPKAIDNITQKITNLYIVAGYITTRTYIPEQDISTGILKLKVVEGFIEGITYFEDYGLFPKQTKKLTKKTKAKTKKKKKGPKSIIETSFPTKAGDLLILKNIEQGTDQINRVPSSKATIDIKPGKKPGGSILEVTNKIEDKYRGRIKYGYDRYREYIGKRFDATVEADNLLNLNDSWYLAYSGGATSNALNYYVSMPYQYWSFWSSGSYSEQENRLTVTADQYTQTSSLAIGGDYLTHRDQTSKTKLNASLSHKWHYRYINATALTPHELTVVRLGGSYEKYMRGRSISVNGGLSVGLPLLATKSSNEDGAPQTTFIKLDGTFTHYTFIDQQISLYTTIYGQLTPQVLYSSEQATLGGSTSVRGFSKGATAGEAAFYVQNEASAPISYFINKLRIKLDKDDYWTQLAADLKPYAFLDAGTVYDQANDEKYWMAGGGLGLRYAKGNFELDVNVSTPLLHGSTVTKPDGFEATISASYKLF